MYSNLSRNFEKFFEIISFDKEITNKFGTEKLFEFMNL